jgi:HicA toxin of bacterial toxin-antitoxin,
VRGQRASHIHLRHPILPPLTIPNHKEIAKGTLRAILNQTNLTIEEFLEAIELPYEEELEEDSVEAIEGLLEDLDVDSVELQHNLSKFWLQGSRDEVSN